MTPRFEVHHPLLQFAITAAFVFTLEILPLWFILTGTALLCLAYFTTLLVRAVRGLRVFAASRRCGKQFVSRRRA